MHDRVLAFAVIAGWAALWMCMGALRLLGLEIPGIGGVAVPAMGSGTLMSGSPAAMSGMIQVALRLLGVLQIGVALLFVAALVPARQEPPPDRAARACGYAWIVLGLTLGLDSIGTESGSLALHAVLFAVLAASALLFSMQQGSSRTLDDDQVFTWAQRQAVLDETLERLARRERLNQYSPSCRTSSPTSKASR